MMTKLTHIAQKSGRQPGFSKRQVGFTLVELMIAGFLGLLLIGGVIQLFLGSNQNYRMQDDLAVMQEDGRFALMFLKEQIQQASFTERSLDPFVDPISAALDGANDSFAINYYGTTDCNGNNLAAGTQVTNTFDVVNGQLRCSGSGGGGPQPIISNVESFQVLYGVEVTTVANCFTGAVNRYMTATQLNANANPNLIRVLSIKVGLLLASDDNVLPQASPLTYQVLDQNLPYNDRISRRVFQQTISMPNPAWSAVGSPQAFQACGW